MSSAPARSLGPREPLIRRGIKRSGPRFRTRLPVYDWSSSPSRLLNLHASRAASCGRLRFPEVSILMPDDSEQCCLCGDPGPLQGSHIIPAFVFRYLWDTSVGLMRTSVAPNRRVQDGPTIPLLCAMCEGRLGKWEGEFGRSFFVPFHEDRSGTVPILGYGAYARRGSSRVTGPGPSLDRPSTGGRRPAEARTRVIHPRQAS